MTAAYMKVPKTVVNSELSVYAQMLFIRIADRYSLSKKNGWRDRDGRVYVIYTVKEATEALKCSKSKALKVFAELKDYIKRKAQGQGKPHIIYINPKYLNEEKSADSTSAEIFEPVSEVDKKDSQGCEKNTSGGINSEPPDVSEKAPNNINNNKNKYNKNNLCSSYPISPYSWLEERKEYIEKIKSNINYEALTDQRQRGIIDEIVTSMANTLMSTGEYIFVAREYVPAVEVKRKILALDQSHIEYVYECLRKNRTDIKNMPSYLLTTLYRAADYVDIHYQSMINYCARKEKEAMRSDSI